MFGSCENKKLVKLQLIFLVGNSFNKVIYRVSSEVDTWIVFFFNQEKEDNNK